MIYDGPFCAAPFWALLFCAVGCSVMAYLEFISFDLGWGLDVYFFAPVCL
jgi:hypothetical protein